jgi:hypothetical protein
VSSLSTTSSGDKKDNTPTPIEGSHIDAPCHIQHVYVSPTSNGVAIGDNVVTWYYSIRDKDDSPIAYTHMARVGRPRSTSGVPLLLPSLLFNNGTSATLPPNITRRSWPIYFLQSLYLEALNIAEFHLYDLSLPVTDEQRYQ